MAMGKHCKIVEMEAYGFCAELVNGTDHFQINGINCPIELNCSFLRLWPRQHILFNINFNELHTLCIRLLERNEYLHLNIYLLLLLTFDVRIQRKSECKNFTMDLVLFTKQLLIERLSARLAKWSILNDMHDTQMDMIQLFGFSFSTFSITCRWENILKEGQRWQVVNRNLRKW